MTSFTALAPTYRRTNSRRAVGYLLLIVIAYAATVEMVHSHGFVSQVPSDVAAFCDAGGSHTSHTGRSHQIECSVCAFQQQLFNGLVHAPLFAITPLAQIASINTPTVTLLATSITQPSGRAPPSA